MSSPDCVTSLGNDQAFRRGRRANNFTSRTRITIDIILILFIFLWRHALFSMG